MYKLIHSLEEFQSIFAEEKAGSKVPKCPQNCQTHFKNLAANCQTHVKNLAANCQTHVKNLAANAAILWTVDIIRLRHSQMAWRCFVYKFFRSIGIRDYGIYFYGIISHCLCVFIILHKRLEWIYTPHLSKLPKLLARNERNIWKLSESNGTRTGSTKWLSVCLQNKWLWVRIPLQSLSHCFFNLSHWF